MERPLKEPHPALRSSPRLIVQLRRSIVCSAIGFGADALILILLVELARLHYLASNAVSFVSGTTVVYALSRLWVFPSSGKANKRHEYLMFLALGASGLALNSLFMWLLIDGLKLYYVAGKVISACVVFFYNFACRRYIVFGGRPRKRGSPPQGQASRPGMRSG
jgi:putative flippase GtrA